MTDAIHVTRWGSKGPHVLMIHGGPQGGPAGGAGGFAAQKALADRGWQLVLPDRPGHGLSPSRGAEDMEVDATWVAEMLGGGSHLVGHSYGGLVALAAAGLRPDAVKSLTLVEAPVYSAAADNPAVQAFQVEQGRIQSSDLALLPKLMRFSQLVMIPREDMGNRPTMEQLTAMGAGLAAMRSPDDWDSRPALTTIIQAKIPVLAVSGGGNPAFVAIGEGLARMTGGRHIVIKSGHHLPQLIEGQFNDAIDAFMRDAESTYPARQSPAPHP